MKNFATAILGSLFFAAPVCAEDGYPSRPITMIVPFAPGGSTDVIGRVVAEGLRQVLGQAVVVENRGGAGGSIGTAAIATALPDGYTIGMGTASTLAINPATYKNLPFDVLDDLVPMGKIADVPNIMSVNPSVAASDMPAFIALARAQPGTVLCLGGHRFGEPSARRAVQAGDRHRHRARALSRCRAGADRRHCRAGRCDVRQSADLAAARPGRTAARLSACRARSAWRRCPTCRPSPNSSSTT